MNCPKCGKPMILVASNDKMETYRCTNSECGHQVNVRKE